jgi:putative hydrolase
MSGPSPFGGDDAGDDPFRDVPPLFRDLVRMLGNQTAGGGLAWDQVRAFALQLATGGTSEPNPDPLERISLEQLARVAELHVAQITGLRTSVTGRPITIVPVTRALWIHAATDAYRPLFEALAGSLAAAAAAPPSPEDAEDPMAAMLHQVMGAAAPMLLSIMAGSMLGHLAQRSFGRYDLPIPRPPSDELVIVAPNVREFGEAWSLAHDDLLLWVCLHEVTHHAVLAVPHIGATLTSLLTAYAGGFEPGTGGSGVLGGLEQRMADMSLDDPASLAELQASFADPHVLLGAMQSDAQRALLPRLEALVAVVTGYVDWVMDSVGATLIGGYPQLTEALRRRRVEDKDSDRFVEQLLGLELRQSAYDRGTAFISGVVERAGPEALERLWTSDRELPTPAEIDAPGLWLARIDLPD